MYVICMNNYPVEALAEGATVEQARERCVQLHAEFTANMKCGKERFVYQFHNVPLYQPPE